MFEKFILSLITDMCYVLCEEKSKMKKSPQHKGTQKPKDEYVKILKDDLKQIEDNKIKFLIKEAKILKISQF